VPVLLLNINQLYSFLTIFFSNYLGQKLTRAIRNELMYLIDSLNA